MTQAAELGTDIRVLSGRQALFIGYTLAVVLAIDLAVWLTHYLQHKVVVLWQFHQVHHSAEVLTPMTVYRMHPVDLFFTGFISSSSTSKSCWTSGMSCN